MALAEELDYLCPAPIDEDLVDELNWLAAAVFRVMGATDVSRVDFRLDANDNWKPYILEINPLPGLAPVISDLVIEARADGIDHATAGQYDPGRGIETLRNAIKPKTGFSRSPFFYSPVKIHPFRSSTFAKALRR